MMETTIALVLQEMLRPETGATAREAGARVAEASAGVAAGVQLAVPHPGEEEEVPEEVVEAVEAMADAEVQAIAAMVRAVEAEAETADVEVSVDSFTDIEEAWKHRDGCIYEFLARNHEAMVTTPFTVYAVVTSGQS